MTPLDPAVNARGAYPSPVRRWLAFGIDYLVIGAYVAILVTATLALSPHAVTRRWQPFHGQLVGILTLTLPVVLYFTFCEGSSWQATPGKRLLRLRVLHYTGRTLRVRESLLRSALKFLPWEMAHTILWRIPGWPQQPVVPAWSWIAFAVVWLVALAFLVSPFLDRQRRSVYDLLVGSLVLRAENRTARK